MLCRYRCDHCNDWHPLGNIPDDELMGAWISFMMCPPEPFTRQVWDLLFRIEFTRRHR
jgi:hypothetical protein